MNKGFIEWSVPKNAYVCLNCNRESYNLSKHCHHCGSQFDLAAILEKELNRSCISEPEKVRNILNELRGLRIKFWDYSISHAIAKLRVAHDQTDDDENCFNTVIVSSGTERISASTESWNADLSIETTESECGTIYILIDKESGFLL